MSDGRQSTRDVPRAAGRGACVDGLGSEVRRRRAALGLTQAELAARLTEERAPGRCYQDKFISDLERGRRGAGARGLSLRLACALARALGCTVDELARGGSE